jgi:methylmalonyl-CoA/ethylmalonyl-CoA epimerase
MPERKKPMKAWRAIMTKIDHLGIVVSSIQQARPLYEALGLAVLEDEEEEEGVRSVMIPVGESRLRLIEASTQHEQGLHHLALHVDDISGTFEKLKLAGIPLLSEEIEIGAGGRLRFLVDSAAMSGVLLEICQDPISAV